MVEEPRPPADQAEIHWNFEKFVIDRDGRIAARFAPEMVPDDARVVSIIETELAR
jgi:glutathione peroxidase